MEALLGKVQGLDGKFFAKDADGNVVELNSGDEITQGMTVYGDPSNSSSAIITVAMEGSSEIINLSGSGEQLFDNSLINEDKLDGALAKETVDSASGILAALEDETNADKDEEVVDEETAAGEEDVTGSGDSAGVFAARDGSSTDISAGLRDAQFFTDENRAEGDGILLDNGIALEEVIEPTVDVIRNTVTKTVENEETFTNYRTETEEFQDTRTVQETFTNYRTETEEFEDTRTVQETFTNYKTETEEFEDTRTVTETFTDYKITYEPGYDPYNGADVKFNLNGSEKASFDGTTTEIQELGHDSDDISIGIKSYFDTKDEGQVILYNTDDNGDKVELTRVDIDDYFKDIGHSSNKVIDISGHGTFDSYEVIHSQNAKGTGERSQEFKVDGVTDNTPIPDVEIRTPFENTREVTETFTNTREIEVPFEDTRDVEETFTNTMEVEVPFEDTRDVEETFTNTREVEVPFEDTRIVTEEVTEESDTLVLNGDIDLSSIDEYENAAGIDFEVVDLNTSNNIELALDDVLDLTDANNTLTIVGDSDNSLDIDTTGYTSSSNNDGNFADGEIYSNGSDSITLTVDEQIDVTVI